MKVTLLITLGWVIGLTISIKGISRDNNDNLIINRTNQKYLDTITYIGLNLLNIKGTRIVISDLPRNYKPPSDTEGNVQGFIKYYGGNYYGIYIIKADVNQSITILAHEIVHLYQYHSKRLKQNSRYYIWDNDTLYKPLKYRYMEKPWEIQAFQLGYLLDYGIKNLIIE